MKNIIIAGIGTEVGKTVVAAIVTEALQADYWKPVQAGNLEWTDTDTVRSLVSNTNSRFHKEAYRLVSPMSPHAAAAIDGIQIEKEKLAIPETVNKLIIELAGGVMVPLNNQLTNFDMICEWKAPVIIVSKNYLGSINHTLLTVKVLEDALVPILGIVFNGERNNATEDFILNYTGINCLARINQEKELTGDIIKQYAEQLKKALHN